MKEERFYGMEMPTNSGIIWGSSDPTESAEICKGVALWKLVVEGEKNLKKTSKKRPRKGR